MRVLLSVVGTRGDVQPLFALAREVRALGHEVRLAIPPNFVDAAGKLGFEAASVGIEMRAPRPGDPPPKPIPDLITDQFERVDAAADGCDVLLGANAHQYAARSIAERRGVPYVSALYAPTALPSEDACRAWNQRALERVNANRDRLGLRLVEDVLRHVVGDRPWLATDPLLDPAVARTDGIEVEQTGTWLWSDDTPLPLDVEAFLASGDPPVHLGFGSMPAAEATLRVLVDAARSAGRRAIVCRGWANVDAIQTSPDCLVTDELNHQALFPRVACVVHHGGAGTTANAARAGVPQVIVPMYSDQPYWASRVSALGVGASATMAELGVDRLAAAIRAATAASICSRAREVATAIVCDGAAVAARRLVGMM